MIFYSFLRNNSSVCLFKLKLFTQRFCIYSHCINASSPVIDKTFFITTPIFYVNAPPHLGHLFTVTLADAIHRYQSIVGREERKSIFSTGTDEHGLKIQQASYKESKSPALFCKENSQKFKSLFDTYGIDYSKFVRTTDNEHIHAVSHFYSTLVKRGHVYKGEYSGWYCISDESFLTDSQVDIRKSATGEQVKVSIESGNSVEWATETNYKFKLSNFQDDLLYWLKKDNRVTPTRFLNDLRHMIEKGLADLSISRPIERVSWGIPVPDDETQSIYVWVDALVNYLTAVGYPGNTASWPPSVQVLGKDILKFHGIYWPALLMAAGLEPPEQLFVHSHWTVDGVKMSKSLGNVVCPDQAKELMTIEGVRYNLLRQGTPHSDGSWREKEGIVQLNAELADALGNLVHRCTGKNLNSDAAFPVLHEKFYKMTPKAKELSALINSTKNSVGKCFDEYNFYQGVDLIMEMVRCANTFFQEEKPWTLKNEAEHLSSVLHLALSAAHAAGIMLQPIVPWYACRLLDILAVPKEVRRWEDIDNFPSVNGRAVSLGERLPLFKKIKVE